MRQSHYFSKTLKNTPKEETSRNAQLLIKGRFIDKLMAGVYTILPLGFRVLKKIEHIIREEMDRIGGQEIFMPALHPLENYITTKRDNINVLFHLESVGGKKMVLGQSHEEIVVPLVRQHVESYQDLPLYLYQIQTKFRNELRAKSGILRSREFIMKDLYSFHADAADFEKYYETVQGAYRTIFSRAGIGDRTYLTFASGGTFSKFSHEFQTVTEAGEDTINLCEICRVAVNEELIADQNSCPTCGSEKLIKHKAIEVANIFPLQSRFSDAFGLRYAGRDGTMKPIIMGCYGIGLTRLMGAVAEVHNDANGLVWPDSMSPFDAHLVSLGTSGHVIKKANALYDDLIRAGFDILFDDRDESAGTKLKDADLFGISVRLVVSEKTGAKVEWKFRRGTTSKLLAVASVKKNLSDTAKR